jgi:hypothetical protein
MSVVIDIAAIVDSAIHEPQNTKSTNSAISGKWELNSRSSSGQILQL